jgi:FKBP-type peptidyl-prolyl cis-trans isomerase FkpA
LPFSTAGLNGKNTSRSIKDFCQNQKTDCPKLQEISKIQNMMKYLALIGLASILFFSCKKEEQLMTIDEYITKKALTSSVQKDSRGFYYKIEQPGSGTAPTINSKVTLFYKGYLTNGTVFDQTGTAANYESGNPVTFNLNQLISGWQVGLPLIKPGGKIILYLPPSLGYGAFGAGSIPGNAALIFEITLVAVS